MQTHIVGLIVTIIFMASFALFILCPFVSACRAESRRIADLLSQLPPDIDVEGLVRRALVGSQPSTGSSNQLGSRHMSDNLLKGEGSAGSALQAADSGYAKGKGPRKGSVTIV